MPFDRAFVASFRFGWATAKNNFKTRMPLAARQNPADICGGDRVIARTQEDGAEFRFLSYLGRPRGLDKQGGKCTGEAAKIREHLNGTVPTERETTGSGMHKHQAGIDSEYGRQAASCERQMSAAIEYVSSGSADGQLETKESQFAMREQTRHQGVSFGRHV